MSEARTIYADLRINYKMLGYSVRRYCADNDLTHAEFGELVGCEGAWVSAISRGMSAPSKQGTHVSMSIFLSIINLIHYEDSPTVVLKYFEVV